MQGIIFGPVNSRRFGVSLGVDVVGVGAKQCNFDCLYCELAKAEKTERLNSYVSTEEIAEAAKEALRKYPNIDVLTITANGEPTLYPELKKLVELLNNIKGGTKLLILSNGSTIGEDSVQDALLELDIVKLSLDCATDACFKKIDRPVRQNLADIIEGMKSFRRKFKGELVIETLFVDGVNDNFEEVDAINAALAQIKPDRVDIGTIDRPPAYNVKPVSIEKLQELRGYFTGLNIAVAYRKNENVEKHCYTKENMISTLKNRPFTDADVEALMDESSRELFYEVVKDSAVQTQSLAGVKFYYIPEDKR